MTEYFAHSREGTGPDGWQKLEEHLIEVADLAKIF